MSDKEKLTFSLANLTWGQMEFLTDYTGRTNDEMLQAFAERTIRGKDVIAIMAIAQNPADPASAVESIRQLQVADVHLNFEDIDTDVEEDTDTTD